MSLKKKIVSIAAVGACALVGTALVPAGPAYAVIGGNFHTKIYVDPSDMSAMGDVGDTAFGGQYTAVLTAVGHIACALVTPQTEITGLGIASGNPAQPHTPGTCQPIYGEVTYYMTWVAALGISGSTAVQCVVALSRVTCTPAGASASF